MSQACGSAGAGARAVRPPSGRAPRPFPAGRSVLSRGDTPALIQLRPFVACLSASYSAWASHLEAGDLTADGRGPIAVSSRRWIKETVPRRSKA
jgi:hypothetical protein